MERGMVSRLSLLTDMTAMAVSSSALGEEGGCSEIISKRGVRKMFRGVQLSLDCRAGASAAATDRFSFASLASSLSHMSMRISTCHGMKIDGPCHFGSSGSHWERHAERSIFSKVPGGPQASVPSLKGPWIFAAVPSSSVRGMACSAASPAAEAADIGDPTSAVGVFSAGDSNRLEASALTVVPKTRARHPPRASRLEGWLEESLAEIVKNLRDAPFLHFVFDSSSTCGAPVQEVRSVRHQVPKEFFRDPDRWVNADDTVMRLSGSADGMILVHKLGQETLANAYGTQAAAGSVDPVEQDGEEQGNSSDFEQPRAGAQVEEVEKWQLCQSASGCEWKSCQSESGGDHQSELHCVRQPRREGMRREGSHVAGIGSSSTDIWGLVVQGRESKHHACYILRTTRVVGESGTCTRFSVVRAKCFGPALHTQLENSWLI